MKRVFRSTVATVSHQHHHHPCSSLTHRRNLTLPLPNPFLRRRKPWCPVAPSTGQQRPSGADHLVGRNGHDLERSPCQELRQPRISLRALLGAPQHGMRPDHKNTPRVVVTLLGDLIRTLVAVAASISTTASGFIFDALGQWQGFLSLAIVALVATGAAVDSHARDQTRKISRFDQCTVGLVSTRLRRERNMASTAASSGSNPSISSRSSFSTRDWISNARLRSKYASSTSGWT